MNDINPLERLIQDILALEGSSLPPDFDPQAIEIEIDGRKLRLLAHEEPTQALLEVDVCGLSPDQLLSADLLQLLHRLNHEARFVHGWIAIIDDSDGLLVSRTLPSDTASPQQLTAWVQEGLDRAVALEALLNREFGQSDSPTEPLAPTLGRAGPDILA